MSDRNDCKRRGQVYLITREKDSELVASCLKENIEFDVILFWENVQEAKEILNISEVDFVVLAFRNSKETDFVLEILTQNGVPIKNIIDFYRIYNLHLPQMVVDRNMLVNGSETYNGAILGLSHTEVGIIEQNMSLPTVNLSVSSQDIYYDYVNMQYMIQQYDDRIRDLKYVIIDLYKYNYFNFDVSKSRMAHLYYAWSGQHTDEHNFYKNHIYDFSFEDLNKYLEYEKYPKKTNEALLGWERLFEFDLNKVTDEDLKKRSPIHSRNVIVTDEVVANYNYSPNNVIKRFDDTIEENKLYFDKLIQLIQGVNHDVKIYAVQMPMFCDAWKRAEEYYSPWKQEFYEIMEGYKQKYSIEFWDFTEHPIANERICWYDTEHLNYYGALKFTDFLNQKIMDCLE